MNHFFNFSFIIRWNTQIHQNTVFFSGLFFDHVLPLTDRDEGVTAPFEADGSLSLVNMAATYAGDIYGVNDLVRKSDHIHWDEDVNWLYLTCGTIYIYVYILMCVCVLDGEGIDETWLNDVKWLFVGDVGRIPEHSGHQRFWLFCDPSPPSEFCFFSILG